MDKEHKLTIEPLACTASIPQGTIIMQAVNHMGGGIRGECCGAGTCGKCRIIATPSSSLSELSEAEREILSSSQIQHAYRLACQAKLIGDVTVTIPETFKDSGEARGKSDIMTLYSVNPMVERVVLKARRSLKTVLEAGDLTSQLITQAGNATGRKPKIDEIEAVRQLSHVGGGSQSRTVVIHEQKGVTAVFDGARIRSLGLAVDIGTTTLAAYLCDLASGRLLASASCVNPQRMYGEDVISRISAVENYDDGLKRLQSAAVEAINQLIDNCIERIGASRDAIDEVSVAGNTTMQTLFAGLSPASLGVSPYWPVQRKAQNFRAADIGFKINPGTNVFLFPVISGFLGGDAVAAAVGDGLYTDEEISLVIDIGTNGELLLGNRHKLLATSCATGPALEGANISCGMRAVSGAIDRVEIDAETKQLVWHIIGERADMTPLGICGSGLIDAMAAMRKAGVLQPSGRLKEGAPGVICDPKGIGQAYVLVPPGKSPSGEPITITLRDVRAFQLAKSALATGIVMLMHHFGIDKVHRTILTGAFGAHFNWRSAVAVGMIPAIAAAGDVAVAENLAGVGAMMALCDKRKRKQAQTLAANAEFIELAVNPDFNRRFVAGTAFPPI